MSSEEEFLSTITMYISKILSDQIDKYFDGQVTPENVKHIEEFVNTFLFSEKTEGYTFEVRLSCDVVDKVVVERFKAYKNGKPINLKLGDLDV